MQPPEQIVALESEAQELANQGRFDSAAEKHGRAIELAHELDEPALLAALFLRLGRVFEQANNVQNGVKAYEFGFQALTGAARPDLVALFKEMFAVQTGKSYEYKPLSSYVTVAPDLYTPEAAADLEEAAADPLLAVRLLINIGNAYLRMPQLRPALSRYQMALDRPEIAAAPELQAMAHTHVGLILSRQNDIDAADDHLEAALKLFAAAGTKAGEQRRALVALAAIRYQQGRLDEALADYHQALELYEAAGDILGEQRTRTNLGHILWKEGQVAAAETMFRAALALEPAPRDVQTLRYLHWALGQCQWQEGDLAGAAASFDESLRFVESHQAGLQTDEGKVAFLDSIQEIYDSLIRLRLQQAESDSQYYVDLLAVIDQARGRAFSDLLASRQAIQRRLPLAGRDPALRQRPFDMVAQTAAYAGAAFDPGLLIEAAYSVPVPLDPTTGQPWIQAAPAIAVEQLPDFPSEELGPAPELPASQMRVHLDLPALARLVYYVLPEKTVALGISAGGQIKGAIIQMGEAALIDHLSKLRHALQVDAPPGMDIIRGGKLLTSSRGGRSTNYRQQLQALYADLVAPVAEVLPDDGTPIVIEPHSALWLLPFAALLSADDRWLADQAPLLYAPANPVLQAIREEPDFGPAATLRALIVGNPAMPQVPERDGLSVTLRPLPGAELEARAIAAQFPAGQRTLLLGASATSPAVAEALPGHQVIHLATHGLAYADDPNASFVALADGGGQSGVFDTRRVMDTAVAADLVALSACQTGLGKISADGIIGLGRAFLAGGARSVLVSQWNVSDEATARLMAVFYRYYLETDNKAIALQFAMRDLRQEPGGEHPRFWAPFVLIGADM